MQTFSAAERVQASLQELFKAQLTPGDAYIKFQLTSEITVLMSMADVEESGIITADKITPLPSMPRSVVGMMNSRDRVFCIYDLAQLLNLSSSLVNSRKYQIITLEVSKILNKERILYLGLAVSELQGIIRLPRQQIESPENLHPNINDEYTLGYFRENSQVLPILNLKKILGKTTAKQ